MNKHHTAFHRTNSLLRSAITASLLIVAPALAIAGTTERVSLANDGSQVPSASSEGSISDDGRYVAFSTSESGIYQLFVRDLVAGTTERVSSAPDGSAGNSGSSTPSFSSDGRFVVFYSNASNLVAGDTNNTADVFVRDRVSGTTERVNVNSAGEQATGGGSLSAKSAISDDGRYVVFRSAATNLVTGDTNGLWDVFLRDRVAGTTTRLLSGLPNPATPDNPVISRDGRYVAYIMSDTWYASHLFVYNRITQASYRVNVSSPGAVDISADGRYLIFTSGDSSLVAGDTNGRRDVFVYDQETSGFERVNVASDGTQANGSQNYPGTLSRDGRYALFPDNATNLVPNDTNGKMDLFLRDRIAGTTERVSVASDGTEGNGDSFGSSAGIARYGQVILFYSQASNLVSGDTNGFGDMFVRRECR